MAHMLELSVFLVNRVHYTVASIPTGQLVSMTILQIVDTDAKSCYNCLRKDRSRCPRAIMHSKVQHRLIEHLKLNSDGGDLLGVFIPADHKTSTVSLQIIILSLVLLY